MLHIAAQLNCNNIHQISYSYMFLKNRSHTVKEDDTLFSHLRQHWISTVFTHCIFGQFHKNSILPCKHEFWFIQTTQLIYTCCKCYSFDRKQAVLSGNSMVQSELCLKPINCKVPSKYFTEKMLLAYMPCYCCGIQYIV